jgi:hypothetical protein
MAATEICNSDFPETEMKTRRGRSRALFFGFVFLED